MIVCLLMVIINHTSWQVSVEGKLLACNNINCLVDFSVEAKKQNFTGDYSKVVVKSNDCVKE